MLNEFLAMLSFAFGVTSPIFVLVFLGIGLKKAKLIDSQFTDTASRLVFLVALPTMLFLGVVNTELGSVFNGPYLALAAGGTVATFLLLSVAARWLVSAPEDRGVFVQGGFRGNLAIVGLAFCLNAYGEVGLAKASIFISVVTILYNVLSIYTLSTSLGEGRVHPRKMLLDIAKNPLIVGISAGLLCNVLRVPIPSFLLTSGQYVAYLTLPLALICIGATLSRAEFAHSSKISLIAVLAKLIVVPVMIVYAAYLCGFAKIDLGILFLMTASPTAAVSYVMVQAMGGNARLAANIVVISTLASLFTVSFGLVLLQHLQVI